MKTKNKRRAPPEETMLLVKLLADIRARTDAGEFNGVSIVDAADKRGGSTISTSALSAHVRRAVYANAAEWIAMIERGGTDDILAAGEQVRLPFGFKIACGFDVRLLERCRDRWAIRRRRFGEVTEDPEAPAGFWIDLADCGHGKGLPWIKFWKITKPDRGLIEFNARRTIDDFQPLF